MAAAVIDLSQFLPVFHEETAERLAEMESILLTLDEQAPDEEQINALFRAAHSIKGGAAMFKYQEIVGLTHALETVLDKLRKQQLAFRPNMVDVFLEARDRVRTLVDARRNGSIPNLAATQAVIAHLEALTGVAENGSDDDFGFFTDAPGAPAPSPEAVAAQAQQEEVAKVRAAEGDAPRGGADTSMTVRVAVDKVDNLLNLAGELSINMAMLQQSVLSLPPGEMERISANLVALERNLHFLQERVMSIRMLPISVVFSRFTRLVRDLSSRLGKKVTLQMEGETTEIDKGMIEKITDPITHLVRNCIDHGLEMPKARLGSGKPETGHIWLSATQEGGNIVITIRDDGQGLNRQKILDKARHNGLDVHDEMPDSDVWNLIFAPGFSTAERVTDISGRGVGMDVVRKNVADLGGRVEVESSLGHGMTVTIRLPLTLAIMDGISVAVGEQAYVLPTMVVMESLQAATADVRVVQGQGRVVRVRGEYLPVISLHREFGIPEIPAGTGILVLVENNGVRVGLEADTVLSQQQIVVKSVEANFRRMRAISGATILGDGKVSLIIDVADLVHRHGRVVQ